MFLYKVKDKIFQVKYSYIDYLENLITKRNASKLVAFFHGETCFFSPKHLDLLTGVFGSTAKFENRIFYFYRQKIWKENIGKSLLKLKIR